MFDQFPDEVRNAIRQTLYAELNTGLPAKITKIVDYKKNHINVKPTLIIKYNDGKELQFPEIHGVPAIMYGHDEAFFKVPLKVGQSVLLSFAQRSIDRWLSDDGNKVIISDNKKFDLSDCVAHIGLNSFKNENSLIENNDDIQIVHKKNSLIIEAGRESGEKIIIKNNGNIELGSGTLKRLITETAQSIYNEHVHNYIDSVGPSATPTTKYSSKPASVTATSYPSPGTGGAIPPAAFGSQIGSDDLTQKVFAK